MDPHNPIIAFYKPVPIWLLILGFLAGVGIADLIVWFFVAGVFGVAS